MVNPGERYEPGDSVELTFHPDSDSILHIPGRVVRTSKKGTVLHLSRDRIYRLLFREGAHRGAT